MSDIRKHYQDTLDICDNIEAVTKKISNGQISFIPPISVEVKFSNAELFFYTLVSRFYILLIEEGGKNFDFIRKKFSTNNITVSDEILQIKKIIHSLRTVFQHNLDIENSVSDREKLNLAKYWFFQKINKSKPDDEEEWQICVASLLNEAEGFLEAILLCLNRIAKSEHLDLILLEWQRLISRNHSVFEYEQIFTNVIKTFDLQEYFDANAIAKKYKDTWAKELDVLPDNYNFEKMAYKVIERFVEKQQLIPIDGQDIISLGIPPGKQVFELLQKAKKIFYESPCIKSELLNKLKALI